MTTAEVEEVDLGERVGTPGGVIDRLLDQPVPAGAGEAIEDASYVVLADDALLKTRRDDRPRLALGPCPLGGVHQRPS
jgi:hypothetical protein